MGRIDIKMQEKVKISECWYDLGKCIVTGFKTGTSRSSRKKHNDKRTKPSNNE